ncbi:amino acid ABC transporter permease [Cytobacillus sp. IB215665]|uniref:amino acid ABC transporter permease n=1 Tax=Cytobacillus sp. IB215665 TaxID=3097357 RepID=UPI002A1182D7|nr:amino acid ABC transporter permease [Cytobacillus sp. IB215665]MDX8365778.1 amino acid ABC transporter permease [Cytobacillus sp. IB215665]
MGNIGVEKQEPKQLDVNSDKEPNKVLQWLKANLFSNLANTALTLVSVVIAYFVIKNASYWIFVTAEWRVVADNFKLFVVGQYPVADIWRVWVLLAYVSTMLGFSYGIWKGIVRPIAWTLGIIMLIVACLPFVEGITRIWLGANIAILIAAYFLAIKFNKLKNVTLIGWFLLFPISIFLLSGFGILPEVSTSVWGGFLLTLLIALVAIVFSFPIGILLALGRRSNLPIVKWFSILFIELVRGIPLITVLFISQLMVPLFLGDGIEVDNVLRAMIGFIMFSAAYLAENVRGGLQAIPRGQFEAAQALGLNKTLMTGFIILPQALKIVIPPIVGLYIGIFKDTVLVTIVGLSDLLGMAKKIIANPQYLGTHMESYVFVAFVFFIFCYLMSYVSRKLEATLAVGKR